MKLNKMKKRFFSLNRHNSEGFTLVELIVVIAILAILAGVGVPVYSGYITRTNKQADITLISQIEHALTLAGYNGTFAEGESGVLILSVAGIENEDEITDGSALDKAMKDAFGANYKDTLKLKHSNWLGLTSDLDFAEAYVNSSYNGNEDALISQIGSVTNLLKDALAANTGLVGTSFNNFLTSEEIDSNDNQAVSNAAVLYAADTIGKLDAAQTAAVNAAFASFYTPGTSSYGDMGSLTLALREELGTYGAVAALYAHGEAFGQYVANNGNTDLLDEFHNIDVENINNTEDALNQVAANLGTMVQQAQDPNSPVNSFALSYISAGQYQNDVTAYLESMKKIDANADKFEGKLDSAGCYTDGTAAALLQAAIAAGSLNISCDDGEIVVWIYGGVAGNSLIGIQD